MLKWLFRRLMPNNHFPQLYDFPPIFPFPLMVKPSTCKSLIHNAIKDTSIERWPLAYDLSPLKLQYYLLSIFRWHVNIGNWRWGMASRPKLKGQSFFTAWHIPNSNQLGTGDMITLFPKQTANQGKAKYSRKEQRYVDRFMCTKTDTNLSEIIQCMWIHRPVF